MPPVSAEIEPMRNPLYRGTVLAAYQLSLLVGIALLPVALVVRRAGIHLRLGTLVQRTRDAYDRVTEM